VAENKSQVACAMNAKKKLVHDARGKRLKSGHGMCTVDAGRAARSEEHVRRQVRNRFLTIPGTFSGSRFGAPFGWLPTMRKYNPNPKHEGTVVKGGDNAAEMDLREDEAKQLLNDEANVSR
jgi:hypothetical protein